MMTLETILSILGLGLWIVVYSYAIQAIVRHKYSDTPSESVRAANAIGYPGAPVGPEYVAHVESLAEKLRTRIAFVDDLTHVRSETNPGSVSDVWIPRPTHAMAYALALHELGHVANIREYFRRLLPWIAYSLLACMSATSVGYRRKERSAGAWAKRNAIAWTSEMQAILDIPIAQIDRAYPKARPSRERALSHAWDPTDVNEPCPPGCAYWDPTATTRSRRPWWRVFTRTNNWQRRQRAIHDRWDPKRAGEANDRDLTSEIIAYESGEMSADRIIPFFQRLVDSGLAWSLQGHYGRTAKALIDQGDVIQR